MSLNTDNSPRTPLLTLVGPPAADLTKFCHFYLSTLDEAQDVVAAFWVRIRRKSLVDLEPLL